MKVKKMGCDIHGFVEIKRNDKWKLSDVEIPEDRSYDTFAILAGVRNYVNAIPISEPKGLPEDLSEESKNDDNIQHLEYWQEGDGHSFSWLTLKEILDYNWEQEFADSRNDYKLVKAKDAICNSWTCFITYLKTVELEPENIRIVFWFDC